VLFLHIHFDFTTYEYIRSMYYIFPLIPEERLNHYPTLLIHHSRTWRTISSIGHLLRQLFLRARLDASNSIWVFLASGAALGGEWLRCLDLDLPHHRILVPGNDARGYILHRSVARVVGVTRVVEPGCARLRRLARFASFSGWS